MIVIENVGVVRAVIDAINLAYTEGDLPTVRSLELSRAEMDEFMANHPFTGNTGKFYGDDERGSLLEIKLSQLAGQNPRDAKVMSFMLRGIKVYVPEGQ